MLAEGPTGSSSTRLVVIRGNSGSGKSSVARELRRRCGRGCALVEQDYLRRILLWEHDRPGGLTAGLIDRTVRFALDNDYDVILEGILYTAVYADMLTSLWRSHRGGTFLFYLDVSFEETLRRHETRPQATAFGAEDMRGWYRRRDLLGIDGERVIPQTSSLEESIAHVAETAGLRIAPASTQHG